MTDDHKPERMKRSDREKTRHLSKRVLGKKPTEVSDEQLDNPISAPMTPPHGGQGPASRPSQNGETLRSDDGLDVFREQPEAPLSDNLFDSSGPIDLGDLSYAGSAPSPDMPTPDPGRVVETGAFGEPPGSDDTFATIAAAGTDVFDDATDTESDGFPTDDAGWMTAAPAEPPGGEPDGTGDVMFEPHTRTFKNPTSSGRANMNLGGPAESDTDLRARAHGSFHEAGFDDDSDDEITMAEFADDSLNQTIKTEKSAQDLFTAPADYTPENHDSRMKGRRETIGLKNPGVIEEERHAAEKAHKEETRYQRGKTFRSTIRKLALVGGISALAVAGIDHYIKDDSKDPANTPITYNSEREDIADYRSQIDRLTTQNTTLEGQIDTLEESNENYEQRIEDQTAEIERLTEQLENADGNQSDLIDRLREQLAEANTRTETAQGQLDDVREDLAQYTALDKTSEELREYIALGDLDEINSQLETLAEFESAFDTPEELQEYVNIINAFYEQAREQIDSLDADASEEDVREALLGLAERLEAAQTDAQAQLERAQETLREREDELAQEQQVTQEYAQVLDAVSAFYDHVSRGRLEDANNARVRLQELEVTADSVQTAKSTLESFASAYLAGLRDGDIQPQRDGDSSEHFAFFRAQINDKYRISPRLDEEFRSELGRVLSDATSMYNANQEHVFAAYDHIFQARDGDRDFGDSREQRAFVVAGLVEHYIGTDGDLEDIGAIDALAQRFEDITRSDDFRGIPDEVKPYLALERLRDGE